MFITRFTEAEKELIVELLRNGEDLPKELKCKITFKDELAEAPEGKTLFHDNLKGLIGTDLKRRGLFDKIRMIAASEFPVLNSGENGTGKN